MNCRFQNGQFEELRDLGFLTPQIPKFSFNLAFRFEMD